ncbi:hypothetical protein GPJ56_000426 [Histomonas meleagridis]|uniref:uncharacterized protein n=1 Tax=Histomonas meleagridis TaxID=135588 RepID=UPI00355A65D1|nr:hypothetical protein GPJ56_000426 [Histomonas meleagridis]KAH0796534.1 hypothetical protein GO595_010427 [Histomonas meleagridis]
MSDLFTLKFQKFDELQKFLEDNSISNITYSFCSEKFIVICYDSTNIVIYDIKNKTSFIPKSGKTINSKAVVATISPCEKYAVSGHENGQVFFWEIARQSSVSDTTVGNGAKITSLSFQISWKTLIVSQADGNIAQLDISSLLLFLYIKEGHQLKLDSPATKIQCASSCDNSIQLIASSFKDSVKVYQQTDKFVELISFEATDPLISFICEEWHFYIAISEDSTISIHKIFENGSHEEINSFQFPSKVLDLTFLSQTLLVVSTADTLSIINIHDDIISQYSEHLTPLICATNDLICMVPEGALTMETAEEKIRLMIHDNQIIQAIDLCVSTYTNEFSSYDSTDTLSKIQELLKCSILILAEDSDELEKHFPQIAEAIVKTDIADTFIHDFLSYINDDDSKLQLLVLILETENIRPETSSTILREISQLQPYDNSTVEDALLNVQFIPSFIKEAIGIGHTLHYNRFVLHLFDRFFNDILPAFALIVDTGDKTQIKELCEYVFLTKPFDQYKSNLCIVWLHTPNTGRLAKVIESSWENSDKLIKEFLSRAPIKFSSSQQLTIIEMIRIIVLCFENAKPPQADPLFTLIANEAIEKNITFPSKAISSIMNYIFESNASRLIREKLFMKIVTIDYPQIDVTQFKLHCVRAGFSTAIKHIMRGEEDLKLEVECHLLSDTPNDSFELLENFEGSRESAQDTILTLLKPLLYLDPKRTVKLIVSKYPRLHPNQVMATSRKQEIKLYFDTLFEINDPPIATSEDTQSYLRFLASHVSYLVTFLRTAKTISTDVAFEFCEFQRIHIGCAVLNCSKGNYQAAFDNYQNHVTNGGFYDAELTKVFLDNISFIKYPKPVVLRTLFEPLVTQTTNDFNTLNELINDSLKKASKNDVLIAMFSLMMASNNSSPAYNFLKKFVTNSGCFVELSNQNDIEFFTSICKIIPAKNEIFSDGDVIVRDYSMGVVVVSSINPKSKTREMNELLSSKAKAIIQRAEIMLMINRMYIPEDEDATIVLMVPPSENQLNGYY